MWKKLSDLLFEDDEIIDDELEEEVIEKPIKKQPIKIEPKKESVKVNSINLDSSIEHKKEVENIKPVEEKPKSIGIEIDDLQYSKTQPSIKKEELQPSNKVNNISEKPRVIPSKKVETKPAYEFTPVISPIFGISEKDMDKTVPVQLPKKKSTISDSRIGTVISPMYGVDRDSQPDTISTNISPKVNTVDELEAENEVVNFSLDDILARRDLENLNNKDSEIDKTVVFTNHNISLFDEEE